MALLFGIQRRLKAILANSNRDERHDQLEKLGRDVGISLTSTWEASPEAAKFLEDEVVRRIQEAARSSRESLVWILALVSALASLFSAIAAWVAVGWGSGPS